MQRVFKRGQAMLEYGVLLALVISALLIMHIYIKRCYQGRIKQEADSLGSQYSPGHTSSLMVTTIETNTGSSNNDEEEGLNVTRTNTKTRVEKKESVAAFAAD